MNLEYINLFLFLLLLFRFPILRPQNLPMWIAFTGRGNNWKPRNSSRMCCNHFLESDYVIDHKKHVLKITAIPTIEYRDMVCCLKTDRFKILKNSINILLF